MVAIDRKSRKFSACCGNRAALRIASRLPYWRNRAAAPAGHARRAGELVRRVAAQRDKVRHPRGVHTVARADFGRADGYHFAGTHRVEDRGLVRGQLEAVAVTAGNENGAAAALLRGDGRREEIVGLEFRAARVGKPAGGDEIRDDRESLHRFGMERPDRIDPALAESRRKAERLSGRSSAFWRTTSSIDVAVGRHDVEIAGEDHRHARCDSSPHAR